MKKTALYLLVVLIFSCNQNPIFNEKPLRVNEIDISEINNKYHKAIIYKSESNATVNESLQVRIADEKGERTLKIFEKYDLLKHYYFRDSLLYLVIEDTTGFLIKTDTVSIDFRAF
jgi:hypothetical protein